MLYFAMTKAFPKLENEYNSKTVLTTNEFAICTKLHASDSRDGSIALCCRAIDLWIHWRVYDKWYSNCRSKTPVVRSASLA